MKLIFKTAVLVALALTMLLPIKGTIADETKATGALPGEPIPKEVRNALDQLVGDWTYTAKWWDSPNTEPISWDGKFKAGWVLNGSYVEVSAVADSSTREYKGLGYMGYDTVTDEYTHVWLDTTDTGMWVSSGDYDAETNTITDTGHYSNPAAGKREPYKGVTKFIDRDNMSYEFIIKDPGGNDFRQMEIIYKRVK